MLTSPVVRCVKLQLGAEIHYLTKAAFTSILTPSPYISKVYTIKEKIGEVLPELRKEQYDYIIDLHHNLRTFLIKGNLLFTKSFAFDKLNYSKWLLTNFKINRLPKKHIVDRYLEVVKLLGVKNDGQGLDFFLPKEIQQFPKTKIKQKNFIALPIGAGRNTKALTVGKIVTICKSVNYPIFLLGGKQEVPKSKAIEAGLNAPEMNTIFNIVGQCSLAESAFIVKNAKVVLTGDTGLMHIAAAFQKPIISIWGNTVPEFGMYPYYPKGMNRHHIVEVKNLSCRPCSKIGYDVCPKGHFNCIEQLDILEIVNHLKKYF